MPKYIIHIGPHKTGSSYLQASFSKFQSELLARGIYYPNEWGVTYAHFGLVDRLRNGDQRELAADFGRISQSGYDTILISAEDLSGLPINLIKRLKGLLRGAEAEIVFYCRRWSEIFSSNWRERVKQGSVETFPEYVADMMIDPHNRADVNFGIKLVPFARVFGLDRLRLVSFNEVLERQDDLFVDFCRSFLGWDSPPPPDLGYVNQSLGAVDTELIRVLNAMRVASGHPDKPYVRFMELKSQLPVERVTAAMQRAVCSIRLSDHVPVFAGIHKALLNRFGASLVVPNSDRLFRRNVQRVEYIGQDYLLQKGIADTIRDIDRALVADAGQPLPAT